LQNASAAQMPVGEQCSPTVGAATQTFFFEQGQVVKACVRRPVARVSFGTA
jgi:hypothetical protein